MKKILALIAACAVMTCPLVSCGHDAENDNAAEVTENSSEETTQNTPAEEETEAETSEETETEAPEEEATETEEKTTESSDANTFKGSVSGSSGRVEITPTEKRNELVGYWADNSKAPNVTGVMFDNYGFFSVFSDITDIWAFNEDGSCTIDGEIVSADSVSFDGTLLTCNIDGGDVFNLVKTSDGDGGGKFDGIYVFDSGEFYDELVGEIEKALDINSANLIYIEIDNGNTMLYVADIGEYFLDEENGSIRIEGNAEFFGFEFSEIEAEYSTDGKTLTISNSANIAEFTLYQ